MSALCRGVAVALYSLSFSLCKWMTGLNLFCQKVRLLWYKQTKLCQGQKSPLQGKTFFLLTGSVTLVSFVYLNVAVTERRSWTEEGGWRVLRSLLSPAQGLRPLSFLFLSILVGSASLPVLTPVAFLSRYRIRSDPSVSFRAAQYEEHIIPHMVCYIGYNK